MASQSLNPFSPLTSHARSKNISGYSKSIFINHQLTKVHSKSQQRIEKLCCSAAQESSTAAVTDKTEADKSTAKLAEPAAKPAEPAAKPAPAAKEKPKKAPAKPLPEMMQEDIIPSLKSTLESQEDLSQIELSFQDNRLEGSFMKADIPYYFWAFFPDGVLTGPKGFALSSYGSEVSTVEPFLIDEKKITAKHVVFWVEKRLAAQGIIPVWKKDEEEDQSAK
ncbi:hypothetical protein LUZ60_002169 [Juncus effusus]|nr:hypothetical protein LUZ60_002169 [Juncus effusus]